MSGMSMVRVRVLSPSELRHARGPTSSKSIVAVSESIGSTTTFPSSTILPEPAYSSRTSRTGKGDLYSKGAFLAFGMPPT